MGTVREMTASRFFSMHSRFVSFAAAAQAILSGISTLCKLSQNGRQGRYYDTAVNLMHGIAHVYQVDAKVIIVISLWASSSDAVPCARKINTLLRLLDMPSDFRFKRCA